MSEMTSNFIFNEIDKDIEEGIYDADKIITRFPPEPNGYLHIGHAKAVFINFSVKEKYGGKTNLRFDDTNPSKEETEYALAIQRDIRWLGYEWDSLFYASDYFHKMYDYAVELIGKGLAYADDQTQDEIKKTRGTLFEKGTESPFRNRSIEENLEIFEGMKNGKYKSGEKVLRAKIDMSSPNINMRDPVIYRILYEEHHNTGSEWCIYPMYDYAHPIEDAIENITHSLCSIEFEDHRPFYDWVLCSLDDYKEHRPRQIEFARLNLENTLTSKRYVKRLVDEGIADGWDDPRLATLCGMRRRGVTPAAIRNFCSAIGVARANSLLSRSQLDYFIREDLMLTAQRVMAVIDPIKLTISNYPKGQTEYLSIPHDPSDPESEERLVPFSSDLFIEREDFMQDPPKKYYRLFPGNEVRLMGAYFVRCESFNTDENGNVTEVICTYDPETKSGSGFSGRKVKSTIHWVCSENAAEIETRVFDEILKENAGSGDFDEIINKDSLRIYKSYAEPFVKNAKPEDKFQFIRNGFFCADTKYTSEDKLVFNKTVSLKSSWQPEGSKR